MRTFSLQLVDKRNSGENKQFQSYKNTDGVIIL